MDRQTFIIQLVGVSIFTAICLYALLQVPLFSAYGSIACISIIFFVLLTIVLYALGQSTAISKNRNAFSRLILASIMGKMMLSLLLIVFYNEIAQPETKYFIVPFFMSYLIYTIFETYLMMRLSKMKSPVNT